MRQKRAPKPIIQTCGIELEFIIVRALPNGVHLTPDRYYEEGYGAPNTLVADAVREVFNNNPNAHGHLDKETPKGSLEYVGPACSMSEFDEKFLADMKLFIEVLHIFGATAIWSGTNPAESLFSLPREGYERGRSFGTVSNMFSLHGNFSLKEVLEKKGWDGILAIINQFQYYYPLLIAITANSPYSSGVDVGDSARNWLRGGSVFGPPPVWTNIDELVVFYNGLLKNGIISDVHSVWNMARLKFITRDGISLKKSHKPINLDEIINVVLEIRVADVPISPRWAQAIFKCIYLLVEHLAGAIIRGEALPEIPVECYRQQNLYRAFYQGLQGKIMVSNGGLYQPVTMQKVVLKFLKSLHAVAKSVGCGCVSDLDFLYAQIQKGINGAQIQRQFFEEHGGIGVLDGLMTMPQEENFLPN